MLNKDINEPSISVIVPVYNGGKFIKEAVDSILNQSFSDFELIVVDDCSNDDTYEIVDELKRTDKRLRIYQNNSNVGVAATLNFGISVAKGKYIARMDADDISASNRLFRQLKYLENNPDLDIVGSWYQTFGEGKERIIKTPVIHEKIRDTLFFGNCIAHPTVMFKKESFNRYCYSLKHLHTEDYELWCRTIDKLKFANIPEILLKYRVHKKQVGSAYRTEQDEYSDKVKLRNLEQISVDLENFDKVTYLSILRRTFLPQSKTDIDKAFNILIEVMEKGLAAGYGDVFCRIIGQCWCGVLSNSYRLGLPIIKGLFQSPLSNYSNVKLHSILLFNMKYMITGLINRF